MRKIIVSEMISADGFFAGTDGNIDWHVVDEEFNQYAIDLLNTLDTILFGRVTYEMFESYWPVAAKDPATSKSDLEIANKINNIHKIVFSKTLQKVGWNNVKLMKETIPEEIRKLKQQPGKDMVIYGSGSIVSAFAQLGLIDEYRFFVASVILGEGKSLFKGLKNKQKLKLMETRRFNNGNVLLRYKPNQNL
jgi:dihydrofolate reductase